MCPWRATDAPGSLTAGRSGCCRSNLLASSFAAGKRGHRAESGPDVSKRKQACEREGPRGEYIIATAFSNGELATFAHCDTRAVSRGAALRKRSTTRHSRF